MFKFVVCCMLVGIRRWLIVVCCVLCVCSVMVGCCAVVGACCLLFI